MGKIVAVGGGGIAEGHTLAIDRRIVELTGRRRPRALFIPTASNDNLAYWEMFRGLYKWGLGCDCRVLCLLRPDIGKAEIREAIGESDVIYVGGGNTLKMVRRWRHLGVDRLLKKAHERGAVLCGASAGAICWFDHGHSDSMRSYHPDNWKYIAVGGLGYVEGIICPHYHHKDRRACFTYMMSERNDFGLAVDDRAAVEVIGGKWRVLAAAPGAQAYGVFRREGKLIERPLWPAAPRPLAELYDRAPRRGEQVVTPTPTEH